MLNQISLFQRLSLQERAKLEKIFHFSTYKMGETIFTQGEPADYFYVVFKGEIQISKMVDCKEINLTTYGENTFFGEVPILAGKNHLATGIAVNDTLLGLFPEEDFWQMLLNYPSIRKVVLGHMADRFQELQKQSLQHEKLIALGTLAAGLAHELNNPASAACSAVMQLKELFPNLYIQSLKCIEQLLTPRQLKNLVELKEDAIACILKTSSYNPLERLDLENELITWLEEHNVRNGWQFAPNLATGGITVEKLSVLEALDTDTLNYVFTCLESSLTQASLLSTLQESVDRISKIVGAVKSYSYVDRAPLKKKNTCIHQGLDNTLIILNYKLKQQSLSVVRNYADDFPLIEANGSSLNQVWTNLIDNAIDALGNQPNGNIIITTTKEENYVSVEIIDNGPGIPSEIQSRIFEPFFTTKEIGQGTGVGLDLAYRIVVVEHQGNINCFSQPGKTKFQVKLPIDSWKKTKQTQNYKQIKAESGNYPGSFKGDRQFL